MPQNILLYVSQTSCLRVQEQLPGKDLIRAGLRLIQMVFSQKTQEREGGGVVIRDEEGEVVEAAAGKLTRLMDALQSEVEACLAGVMLVGERGFGRIVVETDSLVLTQALKTWSHRLAATCGLICEIQSMLASEFSEFHIDYVPRSCNKVAHV